MTVRVITDSLGDVPAEVAKELAITSEAVLRILGDKKPRKVIVVPGKLVNIVV